MNGREETFEVCFFTILFSYRHKPVILTSFDGVYTGSTYDNTKINKLMKGTLVYCH